MKKFLRLSLQSVLIITLLLLSPITVVSANFSIYKNQVPIEGNSVYGPACRYNIQGWIYVHVEGGAYERGYQQGYLLYSEIIDMIYRWSNIIHNHPTLMIYHINTSSDLYSTISKIWWNYCKRNAMDFFWDDYPEEYKQEIMGITDGVKQKMGKIYDKDITYKDILTLNEMYELMTTLVNPLKGHHTIKTLFQLIKEAIPDINNKEDQFINSFINNPPTHHCNGFIATGNATTKGQIVATDSVWCGGWWFSYYIAQRWNILLDIEPIKGHRIIMSSSPGYIWSDANYYQTDAGLILIDTTAQQGLWSKKGSPLSVRSRLAAQYSNTIDDALFFLMKNNNGIWTSIWLLGNINTGEIARLELGLYNHEISRTFDGFFWSANNPTNLGIRIEQQHMSWLQGNLFWLTYRLFDTKGYEYYTIRYKSAERDTKFEEFGNEFYGRLDIEKIKELMSSMPIDEFSTDCKITDTYLMQNHSLFSFWGHPGGDLWETYFLKNNLKGVRDVPPAGWVKIDAVLENFIPNYEKRVSNDGKNVQSLWNYQFIDNNFDFAHLLVNYNVIYAYFDDSIYAFNQNGSLLWRRVLDSKIRDVEIDQNIHILTDKFYYVFLLDGKSLWIKMKGGLDLDISDNGVYIAGYDGIYKENGEDGFEKISANRARFIEYCDKLYIVRDNQLISKDWIYTTDGMINSIIISKDIFIGASDGKLYCLNKDGILKWLYITGWSITSKPFIKDDIYFGSLDGNVYCLSKEGELKWIFSSKGAIQNAITCYGDYVFFGSDDGKFYSVNKTIGKPKWFFSPGFSINNNTYNYITTPLLGNPVFYNGKIFISTKGSIFCLDAYTNEYFNKKTNRGNMANIFYLISTLLFIALVAIYIYKRS